MPKWTEYTSKDTLADNDEVMLYDATARANKRGLMSKFWDYVVDKMATAVISKLETNNKTIIGAINVLNSDRVPWCKITYPNDNDALAKLNTPALLFGTGTDRPYTIIFEDSRGDSALGGGISVVYGFMYAKDAYGTQIAQHYSGVIRKRKKEKNTWSDWSIIHD